jgi:hypothetical protein
MDDLDHRNLGVKLKLWHLEEDAPGMVFWHPAGLRGLPGAGGLCPAQDAPSRLENRIVEMDCIATRNALILDGMTQIVRD